MTILWELGRKTSKTTQSLWHYVLGALNDMIH
jgi:hypothetical protein